MSGKAAAMSRHAADIDDAAASLRQHDGSYVLDAQEDAPDIDGSTWSIVATSISAMLIMGEGMPDC
jgi:hypothetical protein